MDKGLKTASYYGYRVYMFDYSDTLPSKATPDNDLGDDILESSFGAVKIEYKTYRTFRMEGYEVKVPIGRSVEGGSISCVNKVESVFNPEGKDCYSKLRTWSLTSEDGKLGKPALLLEIVPRGNGYNGTFYCVYPGSFDDSKKSTDVGQEYSINVEPFGPSIPVKVTYDKSTDSFTLSEFDFGNFTFNKVTEE